MAIGMVAVVAISIGVYLYNKPKKDIARVKPDYVLAAGTLTEEYSINEQKANQSYLGKVLQVEGTVLMVEQAEFMVITLEGVGLCNVRAELRKDFAGTANLEGTQVKIKGRCTGLLLDVVLNDCIIL